MSIYCEMVLVFMVGCKVIFRVEVLLGYILLVETDALIQLHEVIISSMLIVLFVLFFNSNENDLGLLIVRIPNGIECIEHRNMLLSAAS